MIDCTHRRVLIAMEADKYENSIVIVSMKNMLMNST